MRAIAAAVAGREQREEGAVRKEMLERIALVLARGSARAIERRDVRRSSIVPSWIRASRDICRNGASAEEAD